MPLRCRPYLALFQLLQSLFVRHWNAVQRFLNRFLHFSEISTYLLFGFCEAAISFHTSADATAVNKVKEGIHFWQLRNRHWPKRSVCAENGNWQILLLIEVNFRRQYNWNEKGSSEAIIRSLKHLCSMRPD